MVKLSFPPPRNKKEKKKTKTESRDHFSNVPPLKPNEAFCIYRTRGHLPNRCASANPFHWSNVCRSADVCVKQRAGSGSAVMCHKYGKGAAYIRSSKFGVMPEILLAPITGEGRLLGHPELRGRRYDLCAQGIWRQNQRPADELDCGRPAV